MRLCLIIVPLEDGGWDTDPGLPWGVCPCRLSEGGSLGACDEGCTHPCGEYLDSTVRGQPIIQRPSTAWPSQNPDLTVPMGPGKGRHFSPFQQEPLPPRSVFITVSHQCGRRCSEDRGRKLRCAGTDGSTEVTRSSLAEGLLTPVVASFWYLSEPAQPRWYLPRLGALSPSCPALTPAALSWRLPSPALSGG